MRKIQVLSLQAWVSKNCPNLSKKMKMRIEPFESDDLQFVNKIETIVRGIGGLYKPLELRIFRLKNIGDGI